MAAATVTRTEWGYLVTGDTGATTIYPLSDSAAAGQTAPTTYPEKYLDQTVRIRIKAMAFSGNATTATCVLTSGSASTSFFKFKCYDAGGGSLNGAGNFVFFGDQGIDVYNLIVTLSNAGDGLYIFTI